MALAEIGLVGLGVMGAALALNIAEKGHRIAVWNRSHDVTQKFHAEAGDLAAEGFEFFAEEARVFGLGVAEGGFLEPPSDEVGDHGADQKVKSMPAEKERPLKSRSRRSGRKFQGFGSASLTSLQIGMRGGRRRSGWRSSRSPSCA